MDIFSKLSSLKGKKINLPSINIKNLNLKKINLNLNLKKKTKEILGIQYEEDLLRVVALKKEKDEYSLVEFPLEIVIPNDTSYGVALKKELENSEIKIKDAVISLPVSFTLIKNIRLPVIPENEIEEAIEWNIKEDLGAIKGEAFFDYDIVEKNGEFLTVVVVIVKLSDLEKVSKIAKENNLNLKVIDSAPIGLINLALKQKEIVGDTDVDNFCVIHIDKKNSFVSFYNQGINIQTLDFSILSYENLDVIQKEEVITKLINEINYFFLTLTEPKQIYLSGYFSKYPEIKTMLNNKFEDKFVLVDLDPSIIFGLDYLSDDYKGPFNIAFSAALRGLEG